MTHESSIRLASFLAVFLVIALWEVLSPRRTLNSPKQNRWLNNLGIILINSLIVRSFISLSAAKFAGANSNLGLLNQFSLSFPVAVIISILLLDLIIYFQHVIFHAIPLFWRLHMMHHADLDVDVTTGLRFHPLEIILSQAIKIAAIFLIAPPVIAVILFEILLNGTSMFNHGNIRIPAKIDRILRFIVVTPDMHRVHHSVVIRETNSNFGFNFPLWDRLFRTYREQPAAGHEKMVIGLSQFRDFKLLTLPKLLVLPFVGDPGFYSRGISGIKGREPKPRD
jgi:sterol desaturase/sphingolipid hydroxylase (fatty acid hydroxylase superfamily)